MIVTLITDFGDSEYVGEVKGVIYSICSKARVVDITHGIRKYDVRHAAHVIATATPYFPRGSIHLTVVDPGVGTARKAVIVRTFEHVYIGPDNGCFSFLEGIEKIIEIAPPGEAEEVASTFHGRDLFARIAGKLACGYDIEDFGSEVKSLNNLGVLKPKVEEGGIRGEVLCVDSFGNVITNINSGLLKLGYGEIIKVILEHKELKMPFLKSYGYAKKGELLAVIGSSGYLEFAVNRGSAAASLGVEGGERLLIK
jgi:hypothetical protein